MVYPGRIRDPDLFRDTLTEQEFGTNTQRAGTTWCLSCFSPFTGDDFMICAKQQFLHQLTILGITFNAQVVFGGFGFQQNFFCLFHTVQDWRSTRFIFVNADTQIDFVGTWVIAEFFS